MTPAAEIIVIFAGFVGLLLAGMWIPFAIGVSALAYILVSLGPAGLKGIGLVSWASTASFILTAVPLFIFMAEILLRSHVSDRIYRGLSRLVIRLPGGLLQTNIAGSAVFAAVSGSSLATAAAIGGVALPQLKSHGYDARVATGSLAAGGTLGILIPPSLAFIVYGTFTDTSVARLFMAGVVPGIVLTALFMVFIGVLSILRPGIAPRESVTGAISATLLRALLDLAPFVILIGGVMVGIYRGFVTPTEAASLGAMLALVIAAALGGLTYRILRESLAATVRITGSVMLIVLSAFIFSYATGMAGVPRALTDALTALGLSQMEFIIAVIILYVALGTVMESLGIMVVTIPLLFPLMQSYGIDPLWFGVVITILIEMGMITPPFGMNLFVIQSIRREGSLGEVIVGTLPFTVIALLMVVILIAWPELATWLPGQMTRG